MKQSNFLKTLSLLFVVMATTFAFASCSSDKDEPENPDNSGSGIGTEAMISYTSLPGTWLIESIKDSETGKVTSINQKVTIKEFEITREHVDSDDIESENGYEFWAEGYSDIMDYDNSVDSDHKGIIFGCCEQQNKGLGSTLIYEMLFTTETYIDNEGNSQIQIFVLSDLHLSGNVLTAYESTYSSLPAPYVPQILGTITMKKL